MRNGFCFLTDKLPTRIRNLDIDVRASTAIAVAIKLSEDTKDSVKACYTAKKLFGMPYEQAFDESGFDTPDELDAEVVKYLAGAPPVKSWRELHAEPSKTAQDAVSKKGRQTTPDFDFVQDSGAILSAFQQVYHLSLDEVCNLHWWVFLELFRNLPTEGNSFGEKRALRNRKPRKDDTPEMRAQLVKAKRSVALVDTRSPEQKKRDLQAQLNALEL